MSSFHARNGAGELLARYSFIEPLLGGRRVLEMGAAQVTGGQSALLLAERGAAAVLSIEPPGADLSEARQAAHHPFVQFKDIRVEELRPGTFDLVLAWDGASLAADPGRVASLAKLLARGGRLVSAIAAPGPALGDLTGEPAGPVVAYEAFAESLASVFPSVETGTQSALVGWVLALGEPEAEPEIGMDGTLAGDSAAAAYVAICGDEPCGIAGLAVVALPVEPLVEGAAEASRRSEALSGARDEIVRLTGERDGFLALRASLEAERDAAVAERDGLRARIADLEASREAFEADAREAREQAERSAAEASRTAAELSLASAETERLKGEVGLVAGRAVELERGLEAQRTAEGTGKNDLSAVREALARAEDERDRALAELQGRRSADVEGEAALRGARAESQAAKSGMEAALERATKAEARVQELEEALEETERDTGRERAGELAAALEAERARGAEAEEELARVRAVLLEARADVQIARRDEAAARAEAKKWREQAETPPALAEALAGRDEAARERDAAVRDRDLAVLEVEQLEGRVRAVEAQRESSAARAEEAAKLAAALARAEESLREGESAREGLEAQVAELGARLETEEERLRIAEATAVEARTRLETVEEERRPTPAPGGDDLDRIREESARVRAGLEAELAAARGAAEEAQAQAAEIAAELQAVRWEKDDLEQRLSNAPPGGRS
jgi:chromosome segregation ATPase